MSTEMARQGRLRALQFVNSDRILVHAARKCDDIVMPPKLSIDAHLLTELHYGVHVKQIMNETGWSSSRVMEQLYKAAKRAGLGIERRKGVLHLVHPSDIADKVRERFADDCGELRMLDNVMPLLQPRRSLGASA
ncbi:hypothetical protein [uncultured Roseovarius sp.]|uniref:hypothetical protein n=1 Tax=uncultured Roseovarius sp. TaxID=293344 RepID=UPI0025F68C03|nr:hypothetical protein [uncultured Roseovarius sp.]